METILVVLVILLTFIIIIPFYRVLSGPTLFDRLLGVSAIGAKTVVLISFIGHLYGRLDMFVDIVLTYAILNFIGVIAIARYFSLTKGNKP
jgi:multicomponent Na+:H+ antiporter subunit F